MILCSAINCREYAVTNLLSGINQIKPVLSEIIIICKICGLNLIFTAYTYVYYGHTFFAIAAVLWPISMKFCMEHQKTITILSIDCA